MEWNETACTGNPTHSSCLLARLLCSMKCFQVQLQGATSRVRRPMIQKNLSSSGSWSGASKTRRLPFVLLHIFVFNLPWLADWMREQSSGCLISSHTIIIKYYAVMGHLPWLKNVNEESDAPQQLIFGSMDPCYDILSLLGLWLEDHFDYHPEENEFTYAWMALKIPSDSKRRSEKSSL